MEKKYETQVYINIIGAINLYVSKLQPLLDLRNGCANADGMLTSRDIGFRDIGLLYEWGGLLPH
jgi:hypothetical protein